MKIVIIGGVAAGAKAAAKARRLLPDADIYIYTKDTHVSYSACGLPYYIEGNFEDWQKLLVRSVEEFEKNKISINLLTEVTEILPKDKKIIVQSIKTKERRLINYDKLILATGASPVIPPIKNVNLKNVFTLKTLEDGINIKNAMQNAKNITIIGGGYIATELSEAFIKNNKNVTLIEKSHFILPVFDEDISTLIQNYMISNSDNLYKIITDDKVAEFIGQDKIEGIITAKGVGFETDMVILSAGIRPNVEIAKNAGILLGTTGAIKVNSRMQTNLEDIYACGDCAEKFNIISNTPIWIPLGSTANKEGRIAAINACGGTEDFEGVIGSIVTRFMNLTIAKCGLSEKYAQSLDYDTVSTIITKRNKAGYMPDLENITLKVIADKRSHRILGAQAIGSIDADKKVNEMSVGIEKRMTAEDMLEMDFTYAPPFSTSEDILHSAAKILKSKLLQ